ncbi:MAG: spore gernimation protein [Gracilibacter sp. BRH_c7a]|nr:MAG: spore gernimation protein [Gracilibacter sp. BRH_c7a]
MIKEGHFGFMEAFSVMAIVLVTKIFYGSPMALIKYLGTAAWYGTLISLVGALVFFTLLYLLMKRFPQEDLFQIFETVTGKIIGKALILTFGVFLIYKAGINLREFTAVLKVYSMPFTPPSMIMLPFLIVVAVMAYVGLEGIVRVAHIFFYLVFGALVLIILLAIPSYDFNYLQPILGYGLGKTVQTGLIRVAAYDEIVLLAIIIRSLQGLQVFKKIGYLTLILGGLTFSVCLICILAAFQYTVGGEHLSGMYQLSRAIYFTRFFQRIESIFLFVWVISSVITVSFIFYISLNAYSRVFNISNHRPLILPFIFLTFMAAFIPNNFAEIMEIHLRVLREFSSVIFIFIPVMVLGLALLRGKKGVETSGKA